MDNTSKRFKADHIERYRFASMIAKGKSILDLACGEIDSASMFINAGMSSYDGVDINEKQLASVNNKYALSDCINYHVGDICSFNNEKTFDIITCYGIIEHVDDYESVITNCYSLLNPGGALLISSPNRRLTSPNSSSIDDKPVNQFHSQEFTPEELLSLLNSYGFIADRNSIYGQRQIRSSSNKFFNRIMHSFQRKIQRAEDAMVTVVKDREPEHFIVVATKV